MELINENLIAVHTAMDNRIRVISNVAEMLYENHRIDSVDGFLKDVYRREDELSTSMGFGVAIPHAQSRHVLEPSLVFLKLDHPIQWNDDHNIEFVFGIAVPCENKTSQHLKILSSLARKLMNDDFRTALLQLENKKDSLALLKFLNNEL